MQHLVTPSAPAESLTGSRSPVDSDLEQLQPMGKGRLQKVGRRQGMDLTSAMSIPWPHSLCCLSSTKSIKHGAGQVRDCAFYSVSSIPEPCSQPLVLLTQICLCCFKMRETSGVEWSQQIPDIYSAARSSFNLNRNCWAFSPFPQKLLLFYIPKHLSLWWILIKTCN